MKEISIAKNIAYLRKSKGITQEQLAQAVNVSFQAVSKWENGISIPDTLVLMRIADLFNVSVDYLLCGTTIIKQEIYIDYANSNYSNFVNNHYLSNGWKIVDMKLSGDGEGACMCAVLLEKEIFEN